MVAVKHMFKLNSYVSFCPLSLFNFVVSKSLAVFVGLLNSFLVVGFVLFLRGLFFFGFVFPARHSYKDSGLKHLGDLFMLLGLIQHPLVQ